MLYSNLPVFFFINEEKLKRNEKYNNKFYLHLELNEHINVLRVIHRKSNLLLVLVILQNALSH